MREKGIPAVHGSSGMSPGNRGAAGKDRPIDPMSGKKFARKRARTGFEPLDKRTGASPSCLRVSHNPCLLMVPFGFAHARRMRPLSVGRLENALIQRRDHHAMALSTCKEITVEWSGIVNRKRRRRRLSRRRSGAPLNLTGRARPLLRRARDARRGFPIYWLETTARLRSGAAPMQPLRPLCRL